MTFHVGQRVACVDDTLLPGEPGPYVKRNVIYTIREVSFEDDQLTLRFFELPDNRVWGWNTGYYPHCFRPLIERKTDISVFTRMLTPTPQNETA